MYKVIVFDAYGTLFDTASVKDKLEEFAGEKVNLSQHYGVIHNSNILSCDKLWNATLHSMILRNKL